MKRRGRLRRLRETSSHKRLIPQLEIEFERYCLSVPDKKALTLVIVQ